MEESAPHLVFTPEAEKEFSRVRELTAINMSHVKGLVIQTLYCHMLRHPDDCPPKDKNIFRHMCFGIFSDDYVFFETGMLRGDIHEVVFKSELFTKDSWDSFIKYHAEKIANRWKWKKMYHHAQTPDDF